MNILANIIASLPIEVPVNAGALLWILPICLSISLVYKAVKIEKFTMQLFVREALLLFITMVGFLIFVSFILLGINWLVSIF